MAKNTSRPVRRRSGDVAAPSGLSTGRDLLSWSEMVLAALPEATATRKLKNISLAVDGKVFAFTGSEGRLVMKLPQGRIQQLLALGEAAPLVMGKRTMREWVVAPPAGPGEEIKRLGEALAYVKSLPRRR